MAGKSLKDYAKAHPRRHVGKCWTCTLTPSVLAEVNEGLTDKTPLITIREWLINDIGQHPTDATEARLRHHRDRGHHEAKS